MLKQHFLNNAIESLKAEGIHFNNDAWLWYVTKVEGHKFMNFGEALLLLRDKKRITRISWPRFTFIYLVDGSTFEVNRAPLNAFFNEGTVVSYKPHIDMNHGDGTLGIWTATTDDLLADDWVEHHV